MRRQTLAAHVVRVAAFAAALTTASFAAPTLQPAVARTGRPVIRFDPRCGPPGSEVTLHGSRFAAFDVVAISYRHEVISEVVADRTGSFDLALTIPFDAPPGPFRVKALSESLGFVASATFLVRVQRPRWGPVAPA